MARELDLKAVNNALERHVRMLTEDLKEADREIRRLRAELAEAQRSADLERGKA